MHKDREYFLIKHLIMLYIENYVVPNYFVTNFSDIHI